MHQGTIPPLEYAMAACTGMYAKSVVLYSVCTCNLVGSVRPRIVKSALHDLCTCSTVPGHRPLLFLYSSIYCSAVAAHAKVVKENN